MMSCHNSNDFESVSSTATDEDDVDDDDSDDIYIQ